MSALDKWSIIDGGTTAHWWLGNAGTACGRDFRRQIHLAYADDPRCQQCVAALSALAATPRQSVSSGGC